jgi:nitrogen PTS system EIIA component
MSEADFDVDQLAAYLHLAPQQIARLVERGGLPGRKVSGAWRFSQGEIHHWLEDRIGLSDDEALAAMESRWREDAGVADEHPAFAEMLPSEAVETPLLARTRGSVITSMVAVAARTGWLWNVDKMAEAVKAREQMASTALDNGVALLHPRRPMPNILGQALLALGITTQGIPFGSSGSGLTDIFFLICSVDDRGHLRTLARLSRLVGDASFLSALRAAADVESARAVVLQFDAGLD